MLERWIEAAAIDDAALEEPAATRQRLKEAFAPGATRRMTQLGMLVGALLAKLQPQADDAVVYASSYGESRALEGYLDSFPNPSPILFQTSIHPSGVQQGLIGRQKPLRELFPLSGDRHLAGHALLTAMLSPAPRAIVCGGEERGTWLLEKGVASDRTFAFGVALATERPPQPLGRLALSPSGDRTGGGLELARFFELVRDRSPCQGPAAPGWRLELDWS